MSIQAQLNNEAFKQLPKTYDAMKSATNVRVRGSMERVTIDNLMKSRVALDDMNETQKERIDSDMIDIFKHFEWI